MIIGGTAAADVIIGMAVAAVAGGIYTSITGSTTQQPTQGTFLLTIKTRVLTIYYVG